MHRQGAGDGFPVGACWPTEAGKGMKVGSHGSTYGGNPLAIWWAGFAGGVDPAGPLANVRDIAGYFAQQLSGLKTAFPR